MRLGGGAGSSSMHPFVLLLVVIAIILILMLPRKYIVVPLLITIFLTPFGQQIYTAGMHLFVARILILVGWIRILALKVSSRKPLVEGGLTSVDILFIAWVSCRVVATVLLFQDTPSIINQAAFIWDVMGGFFLLRFLIRDQEDITRTLKVLACIVFLLSLVMINERTQNLNVFGFIGGRLIPFFRDGAIRSQASFAGPIPAGTFAATLICVFVWMWTSGAARLMGILGTVGALIMIGTSASSTPVMGLAGAVVGVLMWPARGYLRQVRWGIAITLLSLHLVMKAPVWMLINHVDIIGGNSGYHRAMLIDGLMKHFNDWWLVGAKTTKYWGWDMWDQADQFVLEGESGGLATLVCFVWMIKRMFARLGTARKAAAGDLGRQWFFWLLGATLFSHVVSFFGISFSDQSVYAWFALIAIICEATTPAPETPKETSTPEASLPASAETLEWFPVGEGAAIRTAGLRDWRGAWDLPGVEPR
jgi:hypothetical protein